MSSAATPGGRREQPRHHPDAHGSRSIAATRSALDPRLPPAELLEAAARLQGGATTALREVPSATARLHAGVDLGTAYVVLVVVDDDGTPVAVASRAASVVRDGVVVDFAGATAIVADLVAEVESQLGRELTTAATTYPPGVPLAEVQACRYVVEAVGLECTVLVDEPTAANAVLGVRDGAVVDVGGGTTGTAVLHDGVVVAVADEPTGGTHVSLVLAGGLGCSLEEAERLKLDPARQPELLPRVRPVFDRIARIIVGHLEGHAVDRIHLVGGTAAFPGMAAVVATGTGLPVTSPPHPLLVTPLGVALHDPGELAASDPTPREIHHG
ncbi:MAG: ethanolamine utilization protein EutJ [Nitriliruptoraceae bacterium]